MPRQKLPEKVHGLPFRDSMVIPLYSQNYLYVDCNECNQPMTPIAEVENEFKVNIIIDYQKYMEKEIVLGCPKCEKTITLRKLN